MFHGLVDAWYKFLGISVSSLGLKVRPDCSWVGETRMDEIVIYIEQIVGSVHRTGVLSHFPECYLLSPLSPKLLSA